MLPWRFEGQGPNGYMTLKLAKAAWGRAEPEVRDAHPSTYILGPRGAHYNPDTGLWIAKYRWRIS